MYIKSLWMEDIQVRFLWIGFQFGWKWKRKDWDQLMRSVDAENLCKIRINIQPAFSLFSLFGKEQRCFLADLVTYQHVDMFLTLKVNFQVLKRGTLLEGVVSSHCGAVSCSEPRFCRLAFRHPLIYFSPSLNLLFVILKFAFRYL